MLEDALLIELEQKRQLMINSGIENGLHSTKTIQLSKQVDRLINEFEEKRTLKKILKKSFKKN